MPKQNVDVVQLMESLVKLANNKDLIKAVEKISEVINKVSELEKKVHNVLKAVDTITSKLESHFSQNPQEKNADRKRDAIKLDKSDLERVAEIREHFREDQKILSRILKRGQQAKEKTAKFFKKKSRA